MSRKKASVTTEQSGVFGAPEVLALEVLGRLKVSEIPWVSQRALEELGVLEDGEEELGVLEDGGEELGLILIRYPLREVSETWSGCGESDLSLSCSLLLFERSFSWKGKLKWINGEIVAN